MALTYIRFKSPKGDRFPPKEGMLELYFFKLLYFVLSCVIPKANPDFEGQFDTVEYWYVACDLKSGIPERELDFDATGKAIMKMPHNNNCGYWTDNNMVLADFNILFEAIEISERDFESRWSQYL